MHTKNRLIEYIISSSNLARNIQRSIMKLVFVCNIVCMLVHTSKAFWSQKGGDVAILRTSVQNFGPPRPQNYKGCNLPGPEIAAGSQKATQENLYFNKDFGNYTLKSRVVTKYFSYNDRYEVRETISIGDRKIFVIKGQYTEKISGYAGVYLQTIGYIFDEKGFHRFLVDVSRIDIEMSAKEGRPIPQEEACRILSTTEIPLFLFNINRDPVEDASASFCPPRSQEGIIVN